MWAENVYWILWVYKADGLAFAYPKSFGVWGIDRSSLPRGLSRGSALHQIRDLLHPRDGQLRSAGQGSTPSGRMCSSNRSDTIA